MEGEGWSDGEWRGVTVGRVEGWGVEEGGEWKCEEMERGSVIYICY